MNRRSLFKLLGSFGVASLLPKVATAEAKGNKTFKQYQTAVWSLEEFLNNVSPKIRQRFLEGFNPLPPQFRPRPSLSPFQQKFLELCEQDMDRDINRKLREAGNESFKRLLDTMTEKINDLSGVNGSNSSEWSDFT